MRFKTAAATAATLALILSIAISASSGRLTAAPTLSLIDILKGELEREFAVFKTKGDPPAYYMAYEVTDEESAAASASLGALIDSGRNRVRGVDVTIRVGAAQFDNYHPYKGSPIRFTSFTPLSLDDDANQIRRALWAESDRVYRVASMRLLQLKTDEQLLAEQKDKDPDFSSEEPATYSGSAEPLQCDLSSWENRLRAWSSEFKKYPAILGSHVDFRAQREVRTFVNTERTAVQHGSTLFRIAVSGDAVAPDGMDVQNFASLEVSHPTHVPSDDVIRARVQDVAAKLDALAKAPPAEPIVCPAILSGRASAVFFHEIFGHRIEGHRQKDITEGQTFTKMLGHKVLPEFLSVQFDPTRTNYAGKDLIGSYEYDDEGVKARPVNVVEQGVLKTFLLARSPVGEFKHSNGHGRRQQGFEVVSRQSNLIVESSKTVTDAELRNQLIAEIKRQGTPYGLYFDEVSSGLTTTTRRGLQAFRVVPLIVYRVYPDGRPDELIRGVDIVGTPLASFQNILATSDRPDVFNGYCGAESGSIPVSAVSPAILVSKIETEKKPNSQLRLPILPRPEGD
ncbi:MAG: peptidase U62 [Acidobacteriaceae bacterium]|nr:peptidase U62 [Acidobacteriaceae bacterium]